MNTDKSLLESENQPSCLGGVSGSFYGKIGATKITIRRASDDALLTVDLSTQKGKQEAERFCKGTDGYLHNYR